MNRRFFLNKLPLLGLLAVPSALLAEPAKKATIEMTGDSMIHNCIIKNVDVILINGNRNILTNNVLVRE